MADRCVPVMSSWVHQVILTGGELAVQFKRNVHRWHGAAYGGVPGVTCLYPGTNVNWFNSMLAAPSKGHFVHQMLFKKRPYLIIKNPCPIQSTIQTNCCPNDLLPDSVHATISGGGICDGTYVLAYDSSLAQWTWRTSEDLGTCRPGLGGTTISCRCDNVSSQWELTTASGLSVYFPGSASCSPFALVFSGVDLSGCGGSSNATITVTS